MNISSLVGRPFRIAWLLVLVTASLGAPCLQAQSTGPGSDLNFDGSSGIVQITGFGNSLPTNEITIEFWQLVTNLKSQSTIALDPDVVTDRLNISAPWVYPSGDVVFWDFGNINTDGRLVYGLPDSIVGSWQHFAFVASQSGNYMAIYRNGVLVAQKTGMTPYTHRTSNLTIGALLNGSNYFGGEVDEVRIWNVARTNQIAQNMNRSLIGNEAGLVAYWRFDEGSGTNAFDSTGHGFTGDLLNGVVWDNSTAPILTPGVTTLAVSSINPTSAILNGIVTPDSPATTAWFQYGITTNYTSATMPIIIDTTNYSPLNVSNLVEGLSIATIYHYQLVVSNGFGTNHGADFTFTTSAAPSATTLPATQVSSINAVLNGSVLPERLDTTAWFEYGLTTNYGDISASLVIPGTNSASVSFSQTISNLSGNAVYHFQLIASNALGISFGGDATFTTLFGTNDLLVDLTCNASPLFYTFAPGITNYNAGVSTNVTAITVMPTLADPNATVAVQINGGAFVGVASGSNSPPLAINPGFNIINVRVTAQDGITVLTYAITVGVSGPNIVVATTNANGPGSLASAITLANYCPGSHLITLASNALYSCTVTDNFWYGPNAFPPIVNDITIEGNGAVLQRATSNRLRFFYVGADPANPATSNYNSPGAGKLTLHRLTLTNGLALGGIGGGGGAGMGGAIFNQGILILDSVTLSGNVAQGGNGGGPGGGYPYPGMSGGGMGQDALTGGYGQFLGGGFGGSVMPVGSQGAVAITPWGTGGGGFGIYDNASTNYGGGGGVPDGLGGNASSPGGNGSGGGTGPVLDYYHTGYVGNAASGGAFGFGGGQGGTYGVGGEDEPGGGAGGGVGGGGGGGGSGDGEPGLAAGGGFGGGGGTGETGGGGGAGNGGFGGGGGPSYDAPGQGGYGGGDSGYQDTFFNGSGGGAGMGGAVFNHNGSVAIINSTLVLNLAQGGNGSGNANEIYAGGGIGGNGGSGFGGAIFNLNGTLSITNSTIASNGIIAGLAGPGIFRNGLGSPGFPGAAAGGAVYNLAYDSAMSRTASTELVNDILADSSGGSDLANAQPASTMAGTNLSIAVLSASEPNIVPTFNNTAGIFIISGIIETDPLLGPLTNNGGLTPTMAPLPGSPAIDSGDNAYAPATDQRGLPRISGAAVDLGAVELPGPPFFTSYTFPTPGQFQLQFRATSGAGYTVLSATNLSSPLTNWTVLGTATEISTGIFQFNDTQMVNGPLRYYRVRHP